MSIYSRASLDWQSQRQLERQQFNNIDKKQEKWLSDRIEYWKKITSEHPPITAQKLMQAILINVQHVQLSHQDFCKIYMIRDPKRYGSTMTRFNISTEVVQTYISCICRYINARRRPPERPQTFKPSEPPEPPEPPDIRLAARVPRLGTFSVPGDTRPPKPRPAPPAPRGRSDTQMSGTSTSTKSRSRSPVSGRQRHGYRERPTIEPRLESKDKGPSCVMISMKNFDELVDIDDWRREPAIGRVFRELNIDGENFMELDYLFIPRFDDFADHHYLAGIAPKQKFAFVMDSCDEYDGRNGVWSQLIRDIITYGSKDSVDCDWPIYGQWSMRSATTDGSADSAQQRDAHSCGIFTVTNAFCLAFGYNLLCYDESDLDNLKRQRMAAELMNGGFGGNAKLHYPLLDLPGNNYTLFDPKLQASEYYKERNIVKPNAEGALCSQIKATMLITNCSPTACASYIHYTQGSNRRSDGLGRNRRRLPRI